MFVIKCLGSDGEQQIFGPFRSKKRCNRWLVQHDNEPPEEWPDVEWSKLDHQHFCYMGGTHEIDTLVIRPVLDKRALPKNYVQTSWIEENGN